MKILIFKTNIDSKKHKIVIEDVLKQHKGISKWSIDFEDKNNILRIDGYGITAQKIIKTINEAGFKCEEID